MILVEGTWFYTPSLVGNETIFNFLIAVLDLNVLIKPDISHLKLGPVFYNWCVCVCVSARVCVSFLIIASTLTLYGLLVRWRAVLCCRFSLLINFKWFSFDWLSYFYFLLWGGSIIQRLFLLLFSKQALRSIYMHMSVVPFTGIALGSCLLAALPLLRTFGGNSPFKLALEAAV